MLPSRTFWSDVGIIQVFYQAIHFLVNALGKDVVLLQSALDSLHDIGIAHVARDLEEPWMSLGVWSNHCQIYTR